jgi:hypothetical protein
LGTDFVGDWLIRQHTVLGVVSLKNWMLIALAIVAVWVAVTWLTRS